MNRVRDLIARAAFHHTSNLARAACPIGHERNRFVQLHLVRRLGRGFGLECSIGMRARSLAGSGRHNGRQAPQGRCEDGLRIYEAA